MICSFGCGLKLFFDGGVLNQWSYAAVQIEKSFEVIDDYVLDKQN